MKDYLRYLGLHVADKVTGFRGVVTTVSFDLYGCVQVVVNQGIGADGKMGEHLWFDIARLTILSETPVMERPNFENEKGPAEKPAYGKP